MPVNNALTPEGSNALGAAFGYYPQLRRNRQFNDPQASAEMPLQFLRGRLAGTVGLPSDIMNMFRSPMPMEVYGDVNYAPQQQVPYGSQELMRTLPLAPTSPAGQLAGNVGSVVPLSPAEILQAARIARQAALAGGATVKQAGKIAKEEINATLLGERPNTMLGAITPSPMYAVPPSGKQSFQYPQQNALRLAQERASLPAEQGGLGLPPNNTPEMRLEAMNAIDYLHGTERMDRLLAGKTFDPRKATSGPMPFGTNTPPMASNYAMNKADTSLALNNVGNLEDYFQVMPKSMGERGKAPINVENVWYRLSPEKKSEILDKASRIGYEIPEKAGGGFVLHPTSEGMPYSKSHWDFVLNRESRGNPLTALRKTFAESGMLDAYAPSELADIYKLAGFPYEITQTNAPWTSAKGVFTGKALISNPINTSDTATLQETVIPFLKEQFKNDRTRVKTGGVDQWDKNTRFTPKQWVTQLEDDLSKGENSFVWTSIPDKVTKQLEQLGFNGILDTGGKMGGEKHQVVIPFSPDQIRSRFAAFDPFRRTAAIAGAMGVAAPDLMAAQQDPYSQNEMRKFMRQGR